MFVNYVRDSYVLTVGKEELSLLFRAVGDAADKANADSDAVREAVLRDMRRALSRAAVGKEVV